MATAQMAAIDKMAAAKRMIVAAILMSERDDDPLASHVVASSAFNPLRELIESNGDNYVEKVFKRGIFCAATAQINGTPLSLPTNPEIENLIGGLAKDIVDGKVNEPSDLTVNLNQQELRKILDYITQPYNFLKHADRDLLATLDESDFDPKGAIGTH